MAVKDERKEILALSAKLTICRDEAKTLRAELNEARNLATDKAVIKSAARADAAETALAIRTDELKLVRQQLREASEARDTIGAHLRESAPIMIALDRVLGLKFPPLTADRLDALTPGAEGKRLRPDALTASSEGKRRP